MKKIGINKQRIWINIALGFVAFSFVLVCAIIWGVYQANFTNEYWLNNGVEVKAVGYDYGMVKTETAESYVYYCKYKYLSENGVEYVVSERCRTLDEAKAQVGEEIPIIIDPNSSRAIHGYLKSIKLTYKRDFILAVIFCIPVPIVTYLLIYRGIYRSVIDYKIRKCVGDKNNDFINGSDYNKKLITKGEVTKTRKWIVGYVKVKYRDENGETQEKWARSWFTRKEAKFLEQKKFINIVPYKNTYGILEEMPTEVRQKIKKK